MSENYSESIFLRKGSNIFSDTTGYVIFQHKFLGKQSLPNNLKKKANLTFGTVLIGVSFIS